MKKRQPSLFSLPILFIALMWGTFFADYLLPQNLHNYGIIPRTVIGLRGILFAPFLHANLLHLVANSVPLFFMLLLLSIFYRKIARDVVVFSILSGGGLLWLVGRPSIHIGASLLVYSLATFIIVYGVIRKKFIPIVLALGVMVAYGSALLVGLLPMQAHVSWEGHLCGAVGGGLAALLTKRYGK